MATNKYDEIARAAIKLFEQKGYHATSVQDIADEVGLQKGSLYHYISSKEELLLQITYQAIQGFNKRLENILAANMPFRQQFIEAIKTHVSYIAQNASMTTVFFRDAFSLGDEPHQTVQKETDRYLDLWTCLIDRGIASGEFRAENSKIAALTIIGSCNWVHRWYREEGQLSPEQIGEMMALIFLEGLCKKS
jgi:AcrR family transcriptional regulator